MPINSMGGSSVKTQSLQMEDSSMCTAVPPFAGRKSSGEPVREQVPAEHLGGSRYRLTATPGLALGCAEGEGEVMTVADDGSFEVEKRGGNVASSCTVRTLAT